jgi:hypothetical protein
MMVGWADLNERQQEYMKAIYGTDQEQEEWERQRAARHRRSRPADEWRWAQYANTDRGYTPLKQRIVEKDLNDPGTGSTFRALENRELILVRYEGTFSEYSIPSIRLTTKGRKLVRQAIGYQPAKKPPVGTLQEWHWKALTEAWKAGDEGITPDIKGYYARIGWNTWLRLRDYKVHGESRPLAEEKSVSINWHKNEDIGLITSYSQDIRMMITDFGKQYYCENWARYREMYPDVDAPEPEGE